MHLHKGIMSLAFLAVVSAWAGEPSGASRKTDHLILVMTDGLRWQEVFGGAEAALMDKEHGNVKDIEALKQAYGASTPQQRRERLLPFFWNVMAAKGQVFGNRWKGSEVAVTNGLNFSYPGYSETLCGFADPRVKSNDKIPNPNVTFLEWLHRKPEFQGRVAAFAAWDVMPSILNAPRAGFMVNAGYDPCLSLTGNLRVDTLNQMKAQLPRIWDEEPFDAFPFQTAVEYLKEKKPRVLYVSLGETDDWAHDGDYAAYLTAAHRVDAYLADIWSMIQTMPEYRDRTTLVFTTDHGRGDGLSDWKDHGETLPASRFTWLAILGPDTRALGERVKVPSLTQSQIAATLSALLGEDYLKEVPKVGKPISQSLLNGGEKAP